jgi:hypothetical protein
MNYLPLVRKTLYITRRILCKEMKKIRKNKEKKMELKDLIMLAAKFKIIRR